MQFLPQTLAIKRNLDLCSNNELCNEVKFVPEILKYNRVSWELFAAVLIRVIFQIKSQTSLFDIGLPEPKSEFDLQKCIIVLIYDTVFLARWP